ncbi:MAG: glycoside hydrolase family 43 protein [Gorillibacterium sp.]|nr:glycoside hydrolase family 43 protein [Gorillibacterium sp.]
MDEKKPTHPRESWQNQPVAPGSVEYRNPVLPGFYPDPSVIRVGSDFYLVCSSFEYFPGVPIFHSRNLVEWEQIGHILSRPSQLNTTDRKSSEGIYAPTLRYHDGIFYMITTDVGGIGNFYVTAEKPAGPWSDPIIVPFGNIDPSLFFDDDGRVYVTTQFGWGEESHVIQYEIDILTGQALSEPLRIWDGDEGPWVEGPHLYKIQGQYYLMTASGGTASEHREIIARSTTPYGPFEDCPYPILTHRGIKHPIQNTGHVDLIEDTNGDWWALFLGVRLVGSGYSVLGRETFLAPVKWTADGWPLIDNNEAAVGLQMTVPRLPAVLAGNRQLVNERDEFDASELAPYWVFLRNPVAGSWSLTDRPGWLQLKGLGSSLNDAAPVAFLGRRQQQVDEQWLTLLDFEPLHVGDEAGLTVRMNESAHYELAVTRQQASGGRQVFVRATIEGHSVIEATVELIKEGIVHLKITSNEQEYAFFYSVDGYDWVEILCLRAYPLSVEAAGGFTGLLVGMYATGNGKASLSAAHFDWFEKI